MERKNSKNQPKTDYGDENGGAGGGSGDDNQVMTMMKL